MTKAFTLVESLVTMFIIIVLSLIVIPNYNSIKQQLALQHSTFKLAQDIRTAQEMAMSAKEFPACTNPNYKYGYGVYFQMANPQEYILFADCNGNGSYNSGGDRMVGGESVKFEQGIEINALSTNLLSVVFTPPDPTVKISGGSSLGEIILINNRGQTETVKVNEAGLINIE